MSALCALAVRLRWESSKAYAPMADRYHAPTDQALGFSGARIQSVRDWTWRTRIRINRTKVRTRLDVTKIRTKID